MDRHRFDALVRSLTIAHSRRHALGIALASLAVLGASDAAGKKKKKVTICFNGQTVKVLKKKRDTFLLAGAVLGDCPTSPPPPTTTTTLPPDPCAGQPAGAPCPPCGRPGETCFPGNSTSDDCCSKVCLGTNETPTVPGVCAPVQDEGFPCYDNTDCNAPLGFTCVNFKCHKA